MAVRLYDYQREMRDSILEALGRHGAVMCQMPTGTGKTHVLAAVISSFVKGLSTTTSGGRVNADASGTRTVWVVAHRRELTGQIGRLWGRFYSGRRGAPEVRVLSIQWLSRNWGKLGEERPALIVIDEAHHALAETYRELWRRYPDVKKLGMTATPYRMSENGFTDLFDTLLQSRTIPEFIRMRRLSLFDLYTVPKDSKIRRQIAMLRGRGADGDYRASEMTATLNTPRHIEYLHNSLMRYAKGRRGIVYAIDISHAAAIAEYYRSKGIRCCAVDCRMPAKERDERVEAFRRGEIDVLVNVDIFSEGFDCPEVEFIQLARPTLSLAVYLQQVGRGLRRARGKRYCVILDNVGMCHTFGTPIRDWGWERMFEGTAGIIGDDPEEQRNLVRHLGYPGRLEDEPMERVVSHTGMGEAVRHQEMLVYRGGTQPIGIRIGGRVVTGLPVDRIMECRDGLAAVLLRDGSRRLVTGSGRVYPLRRDFRSFRLLPDGLVQLDHDGGTRRLDLNTGQEYGGDLAVVHIGLMEMLSAGGQLMPRYGDNRFCSFNGHDVDMTCWHGFYFKAKMSERDFVPRMYVASLTRRWSWERPSADTVLLPGDPLTYYFVTELRDMSIVIATPLGEYYVVRPTGERELLFRASDYRESKEKYDRWMENVT